MRERGGVEVRIGHVNKYGRRYFLQYLRQKEKFELISSQEAGILGEEVLCVRKNNSVDSFSVYSGLALFICVYHR